MEYEPSFHPPPPSVPPSLPSMTHRVAKAIPEHIQARCQSLLHHMQVHLGYTAEAHCCLFCSHMQQSQKHLNCKTYACVHGEYVCKHRRQGFSVLWLRSVLTWKHCAGPNQPDLLCRPGCAAITDQTYCVGLAVWP